METTVTGIGAVVVAELRAAGYMESTIGQYAKTIKALGRVRRARAVSTARSWGLSSRRVTISPRTGRFSAQRRLDYGRLDARVRLVRPRTGRVDLSVRERGGGGPRPACAALAALDAAWEAEMARPGPGGGHARGLRAGGARLPGVPGTTRDHRPGRGRRRRACWRSWSRCWTGGRSRRCSGWCRTSARS